MELIDFKSNLSNRKLSGGFNIPNKEKSLELGHNLADYSGSLFPINDDESEFTIKIKPKVNNKNTDTQKDPKIDTPILSNLSKEISKKAAMQKKKEAKISYYDLAKIYSDQENFAVMDDCLFYGDINKGYFMVLNGKQSEKLIRQCAPPKYRYLITKNSIREIIDWIKSFEHLTVDERQLSENKFLINFANGVLDVTNDNFFSHSLDYYFTNYVNASYPDRIKPYGYTFENYMDQITGGNDELYMRIQEIFGYIISDIRDLKVIFYFVGKKDTGKSIMLNLLENIVGKDCCSHVSLSDFTNSLSIARLHKKKLNTCGETAELTLSRLDLIKAATGNDPLTGRHMYQDEFEFTNRAAMVFGGNDLPNTRGVDRMNAFIDRLVIAPFNNPIPKENQDINLLEKLIDEKSYIVKWAVKGLRRLIKNNYVFTSSWIVDDYLNEYLKVDNSINDFVNDCCVIGTEYRVHSLYLKDAYESYCKLNNMLPVSDKVFHSKLQNLKVIRHERFRLNGENRKGYMGIDLMVNHISNDHQ